VQGEQQRHGGGGDDHEPARWHFRLDIAGDSGPVQRFRRLISTMATIVQSAQADEPAS